eukprot:UN03762
MRQKAPSTKDLSRRPTLLINFKIHRMLPLYLQEVSTHAEMVIWMVIWKAQWTEKCRRW